MFENIYICIYGGAVQGLDHRNIDISSVTSDTKAVCIAHVHCIPIVGVGKERRALN